MSDYRFGLKQLEQRGSFSFGLKSRFGLVPLSDMSIAEIYDILLEWEDNSNNEDGFSIEHSLDGGTGWTQIAQVGADVTSYLITPETDGIDPSVANYFRVRAYNSDGNSDYSNTAEVIP